MKLERIDPDLELQFITEFATGNNLMKGLSADDRRERIRVAIFAGRLERQPFRDTGMDYQTAYAKCYGRPIELRRRPRDAISGAPSL